MLQTIFVKRVKEEMEDRQITPRQLAMMVGAPKERTIYDVLNRGAVPGLTVVHQVSVALNIPATVLLTEQRPRDQDSLTNVRQFPERYPKIFAKQQKDRTPSKSRRRHGS